MMNTITIPVFSDIRYIIDAVDILSSHRITVDRV